jgi:hypothetical protein
MVFEEPTHAPFSTREVKDSASAVYPVAKTTPRVLPNSRHFQVRVRAAHPGITTSTTTTSIRAALLLKRATASLPSVARITWYPNASKASLNMMLTSESRASVFAIARRETAVKINGATLRCWKRSIFWRNNSLSSSSGSSQLAGLEPAPIIARSSFSPKIINQRENSKGSSIAYSPT